MRRGRPLAADRLDLLVAQLARRCRRRWRRAGAPSRPSDDEVVGEGRQPVQVEQDDVGGLLVLGELDDPAGELQRLLVGLRRRRATRQAIGARGGLRRGGLGRVVLRLRLEAAWASRRTRPGRFGRRGRFGGRLAVAWRPSSASPRPSPSGLPASAQREWAASPEARVRSRSIIPPGGSVEPMVADVGGDRIRDEIAQRPAGRGPRPQLRGGQPECAARRGTTTRSASPGKCRATSSGSGVGVAVARRDRQPGQLQHAPRLVPRRQPGEGLGPTG